MFMGMLRPGEATALRFGDIIFPDTGFSSSPVVFLRINKPKMRWLTARREFVKLEDHWFVALAGAICHNKASAARTWPVSYALFCTAHAAILERLHISPTEGAGLTPASHRTGGATFYFTLCYGLDWIRCHGRWQADRTLEIYIPEAGASNFFSTLSAAQIDLVNVLASHVVGLCQCSI